MSPSALRRWFAGKQAAEPYIFTATARTGALKPMAADPFGLNRSVCWGGGGENSVRTYYFEAMDARNAFIKAHPGIVEIGR